MRKNQIMRNLSLQPSLQQLSESAKQVHKAANRLELAVNNFIANECCQCKGTGLNTAAGSYVDQYGDVQDDICRICSGYGKVSA